MIGRTIMTLAGTSLLLIATPATGQISDADRSMAYFFGAEAAFENGDHAKALKALNIARDISGNPTVEAAALRVKILDAMSAPSTEILAAVDDFYRVAPSEGSEALKSAVSIIFLKHEASGTVRSPAKPTDRTEEQTNTRAVTPTRPYDQDARPTNRPGPLMPSGAQYSGRCLMFFTVSRFGTTTNIEADCTQEIFKEPAMTAVATWTYVPARLNGRPVQRPGVETTLTFALSDEAGNPIPFYTGQN